MLSKAVFIDYKEEDLRPDCYERIKSLFESITFTTRDDSTLLEMLADAEALFVKISTKIDKEVVDAVPNLKYIGVQSAAFDAIDAPYARSKGVTVCNLGGYSTEAVAEFFFASLFEQVRELEKARQQARNEDYSFSSFMGVELKDKVVGVVGAGKIGSRVAEIGLGIGMRVIYFSRTNKPLIDGLGAQKKDLDEVLSRSDFVSCNLALNEETEGIISKGKINLLKEGCVFISLSPPTLLDQEAMMTRAGKGEITFVFDHSDDIEPELAKRFLETKNCVVYPPVAFRTEEADAARWDTFASNIEQFVAGNPQNVVN